MAHDPNQRITELEIQLAHMQRLYEQLDEVVTAQATDVLRMSRQIKELQDQVKELKVKQPSEINPQDEKPPHY